MIGRFLEMQLRIRWDSGKSLVVVGPRQVGKTTLIRQLCQEQGEYLFLNADEAQCKV